MENGGSLFSGIFITAYLIIWFVVVLYTGRVAEKKGYGYWWGLLAGVSFWLIALIVFIALPPRDKKYKYKKLYK